MFDSSAQLLDDYPSPKVAENVVCRMVHCVKKLTHRSKMEGFSLKTRLVDFLTLWPEVHDGDADLVG